MALPTILNMSTPASNLAELGFTPKRYFAWDGTPIGVGSDCAPISMEPDLSGLMVPDYLEDSRVTWGQELAVALLAGARSYNRRQGPLATILWGLAGYMAPLPTAAAMTYQSLSGVRR